MSKLKMADDIKTPSQPKLTKPIFGDVIDDENFGVLSGFLRPKLYVSTDTSPNNTEIQLNTIIQQIYHTLTSRIQWLDTNKTIARQKSFYLLIVPSKHNQVDWRGLFDKFWLEVNQTSDTLSMYDFYLVHKTSRELRHLTYDQLLPTEYLFSHVFKRSLSEGNSLLDKVIWYVQYTSITTKTICPTDHPNSTDKLLREILQRLIRIETHLNIN